jgi:uncharacterized protein (TIGR02246 family)
MEDDIMTRKQPYLLAGAMLGLLAAGLLIGRNGTALGLSSGAPSETAEDRPADREAIARLAQEFTKAVSRGDAKALAALYTENAEYYDDTADEAYRGRAEIEKAYAALFRERPASKLEIQSQSLRFLGRDTAIDEGLAHLQPVGSELPVSIRYSCLCVREDGHWKIALGREWGPNEDHLEDLSWLIGEWTAHGKNGEVRTSFRWNSSKTLIINKTTVTEGGRVVIAFTQRIGLDPQTGQVHSWVVDGKGGHGQAVWVRDGDSWLLDAASVLATGTESSSVNIITRLSDDAFLWRSVERRIGGDEVPASDPVKVVRVKSSKQP